MQHAASNHLEEKMLGLKLRYLEQLAERHAWISLLLASYTQTTAIEPEDRHELQEKVHKMAGTGTIYGFPHITERAKLLEEVLIDYPQARDIEIIPLIQHLLTACEEALSERKKTLSALQHAMPEEQKEPATSGRVRPVLLVVDDDEDIHALMQQLFSQEAHILTALNTKQGMELIMHHKPDIVLLDNMMAEGDCGLAMLEHIQSLKEWKEIPVIMLTASNQPESVMRGLMAGAVDYITKPFNPQDVALKIRNRLKQQQRTILIVDDDEAVRMVLEHKFRIAGYKVISAINGAEAWKVMLAQPIALALLDRMMPGYDGLTLLRMMKDKPSLADVKVVFLTARHYSVDIVDGLTTGAADYITKPFNPDEVVTRCIRLISHKEHTP